MEKYIFFVKVETKACGVEYRLAVWIGVPCTDEPLPPSSKELCDKLVTNNRGKEIHDDWQKTVKSWVKENKMVIATCSYGIFFE